MNPFTMRANRLNFITAVLACFISWSCTHTTEEYQTDQLSQYVPLQVGKYITYQLDSTVFPNFGIKVEVHSYQEKQVVDAQFPDGLGRPSYRILRFIRDTAGTQPWTSAGTYFITPTTKTVEVIENNLRFVKMVLPIKQDYTWKGNQYLPDDPFSPVFDFKVNTGLELWDYTYTSLDGTESIKNQTYNNVLTMDAINDAANMDPSTSSVADPNGSGYVSRLEDKYAKGLGLIYEEFIMWEYQPPNAANPSGAKIGFGVKRSIIDHN